MRSCTSAAFCWFAVSHPCCSAHSPGHFAAHASAGFAKNLRHDMFYRVQTYSFSNIDKFSAASIVTRLTTDVTNVQNAYQMLVRIALRAPSMLIFAMVMAFRMSVRLSLIYLAAIPVLRALGCTSL